eukprot:2207091-Rhodomonas_salina.2
MHHHDVRCAMRNADLDPPDRVLQRGATGRHDRHADERAQHRPAQLARRLLDDLTPRARVGLRVRAPAASVLRVVAGAAERGVGVGVVELEDVPVEEAEARPHVARALRLAVWTPDPDARAQRERESQKADNRHTTPSELAHPHSTVSDAEARAATPLQRS